MSASQLLNLLTVILAVALVIGALNITIEARSQKKIYHAKIAYVYDGDTVKLSASDTRVRLWGIDAPEKGEVGAESARRLLIKLVGGKQVKLLNIDTDRYGRTVSRIYLPDGRDVSQILIERGAAHEYCRYSKGYYGTCSIGN